MRSALTRKTQARAPHHGSVRSRSAVKKGFPCFFLSKPSSLRKFLRRSRPPPERARAPPVRAPARSGHTPGHPRAALAPGGRHPTAPGAHWWCVRGHHLASQKTGRLLENLQSSGGKNVRGFKEEFGMLFPVQLVSVPSQFAVITNTTV